MTTRRDFLQTMMVGLAASQGLRAYGMQPASNVAGMTSSAGQLLKALSDEQRTRISYAENDAERFNWHFVPLNDSQKRESTRKGVPLADMSASAKSAAMEMLKAGTSADGYKWCRDIMAREEILAELEPNNAWFRKPTWYFFTVYGKPAATGKWGWRIDGHHMSISYAIEDGKVVSATPFFLGLNPVTIKHGNRKGERETITPSEDLGRELFLSLDKSQQAATLLPKHLPEVAGKTAKIPELPTGISAGKMTAKQQQALLELIAHYTGRMPANLAKVETDLLIAGGVEKLSFAYSGEPVPGQRHTYNIQGPTFVIHYLNEQTDPHKNPANHIHSIYRSRTTDFGGVKA